MFRELFARSPLLAYPIVGMLIFLCVFLGVVAWVWLRDRSHYDQMARLPLDDGAPHE